MSQAANRSAVCNGQNCLTSTGVLVALRIVKDALFLKIRLSEQSEFSDFEECT